MKLQLVLFVCVVLTESAKLPANFIKCNRKAPDWNSCLLKTVQNALPQLTKSFDEVNLPSFDPLEVPEITVGAGKGPANFDQNYKNCKIYGLDKIKPDAFEIDFDKKIVHAVGHFEEITKKCEYELNGKVLLLPVVGTGNSTILLRNGNVSARCNFEEVARKRKTYLNFVSGTISLNPSLVNFNFENLFNGDKAIGDNINKVLNENWKEVYGDLQSGYEEALLRIIMGLLNNFFTKVSVKEAFD